jgi:solute carrier family 35 protein E1
MGSNTAFATRSIVSKMATKEMKMGAADFYAVMTIISFLGVLPFALILEGPDLYDGYHMALTKMTRATLIQQTFICGMSYYLYNEVSYLALDRLDAVSHAVANTIKRVVILIASVVAFKAPMSSQSIWGSGIAIAGVLLYSIAKEHYAKKDKKD